MQWEAARVLVRTNILGGSSTKTRCKRVPWEAARVEEKMQMNTLGGSCIKRELVDDI